jgi:hypothetical protein
MSMMVYAASVVTILAFFAMAFEAVGSSAALLALALWLVSHG